jgi:sugar O-acyltransferase (sialic acid O-acetyltransferase NeuD family)
VSDRTALIFGGGGHARVIRSLLPDGTIRFLVDRDQDAFFAEPALDADLYIGIGDNAARRLYFDRLKALGLTVSSCIAPTAWVAADAALGEGVFLGPGAVIGSGTRIGDNAIVNTLASVDHDCEVGEDTQITPGATLGSHLRIGRRCYFGMRSCVVPRLEIGDDSVVMAGSLVVRSAGAGVMLGGSPARIIGAAPQAQPAG